MRIAKWLTGFIGIITFVLASFFQAKFGWGDWVLVLPAFFLAFCLGLILVSIFSKK
jgi:hypothetical protein